MPPHAGSRVAALAFLVAGLATGCSDEPCSISPRSLVPPDTRLTGSVVGASGEPVANETVWLVVKP